MEKYSKKRLMQTSAPYNSKVSALDAAAGLQRTRFCEFACVTEDNRVISVWEYSDVEPDKPVHPGQQRVLVPNY
ncbi:hypothetical protein JHP_0059 [Pseudomonas phage JHP]|nr:hypothetical protein JHP_0059 [Pseudomonas phage JHP]